MQSIPDVLKVAFGPGSVWFVILWLLLGVTLLYVRAASRWGRRWLMTMLVVYWGISTPLGSGCLAEGVSGRYGQIHSADDARGAAAVVVLSGGSNTYWAGTRSVDVVSEPSAYRVLEAARVYELLGNPLVIASTGVTDPRSQDRPESEVLREALVRAGIPRARIRVETDSRNTHEHPGALKPLLETNHVDRFVLVTSPTHMSRSMTVFRAQGLDPVPSVSAQYSDKARRRLMWLPSNDALRVSHTAIYEYAAWGYYWMRGWLRESSRRENSV